MQNTDNIIQIINVKLDDISFMDHFRLIRSRYRRYDPGSLIGGIIHYLNKDFEWTIEQARKAPWIQLLLVKWILIDERFSIPNRPTASEQTIYQLMQRMWQISSYSPHLKGDSPSVYMFVRSIGYQQFWTQKGSPFQSVCRQSLMFGDLPPNHYINTSFETEFGLKVEEFITLALALIIRFQDGKEYVIKKNWLVSLESKFGQETLNSFFNAISTQIFDISESLKMSIGGKRHVSEYHENTPLLKFPLVDLGGHLLSWYPPVVAKAVEYFIYDSLRSLDIEHFMRRFGPIFEKYVETSIKHAGWSYLPEQQLMRLFPDRQCTDFLVIESDTKIFIEAKGIGLPELAMTTSSDEILLNKVASSIIKAIKQANELNAAIGESETLEEHEFSNTNQPFLLVVTYKETYLGSCTKFYEFIGKKKIDKLQANISPNYRIPVENIFFLSADDLDLLCGLVSTGRASMLQILERARSDDADPKTAKFMFRMHLSVWGRLEYPAYLNNETNKYFDLLTDAL